MVVVGADEGVCGVLALLILASESRTSPRIGLGILSSSPLKFSAGLAFRELCLDSVLLLGKLSPSDK